MPPPCIKDDGIPPLHTKANGMPPSFTGSSTPLDYTFDIDLPPTVHLPHVQASLYCLGSPSPSPSPGEADRGSGMEAGARLLRSARDGGDG